MNKPNEQPKNIPIIPILIPLQEYDWD